MGSGPPACRNAHQRGNCTHHEGRVSEAGRSRTDRQSHGRRCPPTTKP
jgi:hypothetical protein